MPDKSIPVCRVALAGFGTVGRSAARILCDGVHPGLRLTHIFNRSVARKKQPWVREDVIWTEDFGSLCAADVDIIIELIGGLHPAGEMVRDALRAGKSVVTANKQLIAREGPELLEFAAASGARLEFGASVAGGIPILPALRSGLSGDHLNAIAGILNGTCNYILSRVESARIPFSEALEEAQARGFAEADASEDLDGGDARAKLVILALAGLSVYVAPESIRARTIRTIDAVDFDYAADMGCTIRQVSRAEMQFGETKPGEKKNGTLLADVGPALVATGSPFGRTRSNQNLVLTHGQYAGEMAFLGAGAGGDPTAVAVISDVLCLAENRRSRAATIATPRITRPAVSSDFLSPRYLRFFVKDQPGIVARLAAILASHDLNIDALLQKPGYDKGSLPFVITLEPCRDSQLHPVLEEMRNLDFSLREPLALPIL